ncbi:MAG: saccharopine dehydrogenase NADP-binding domain-containing protein [Pseudomonadales bacterium]|nr:saccharopine dehydrogenase NADP-binding domain-containing protein [Pseudomonadales bacterium]
MVSTKAERELDIVVYGASGFTGRLVCEYFNRQYGADGEIAWAMAGRDLDRLDSLRTKMGISDSIPLLKADADNPASLAAMAARTRVVLTTVGPYQLYGSALVAACAEAGTDYVDLCGEPNWMYDMIQAHDATAKATGARILFSCGFDSIPFELGVYFLEQQALERFGAPLPRVKGRVRAMKGGFSGGTLASLKATLAATAAKPELRQLLSNPFALAAGFSGPEQPAGMTPVHEEDLGSWSAPFVMAPINTKNVHRSNLLMGHPYGTDFIYDEMVFTGPGAQGEAAAKAVAADNSMAQSTLQPGDGPSQEERENGLFDVLFVGSNTKGEHLMASVKGNMDPGYGSTSKMIAETAVCLVKHPAAAAGGIWTPGAALQGLLIDRLAQNAGMTFALANGA